MNEPDYEVICQQAEAGDAEAQFKMGCIFQQGLFEQPADLQQALHWFQLAGNQDHVDSLFNLALLCFQLLPQQGGPVRSQQGLTALERAAALGDLDSMGFLGQVLIKGADGVATDPQRGIKLCEDAGSKGHGAALTLLGKILLEDRWLKKDEYRAYQYFEEATRQGDPEGLFMLGVCQQEGRGTAVNLPGAMRMYESAAENGLVKAKTRLGSMYWTGEGGVQDTEQGTQLMSQAAQQGDPLGLFFLGEAFRIGRGVGQDLEQAFRCYLNAAQRKQVDATFALGLCFEHGQGCAQDLAQAEQCYQFAAMEGHGGAAHNLGIFHAKGIVVQQDLSMALELMEYAISLGEDDAMFSAGLACYQLGDNGAAWMWGLLSKKHRPEGQGPALLEKLTPILSDEEKRLGQERADTWDRPDKTMAWQVRS